ncbi:MAG: hypothetical protein K0U93_29510 [Gammaproteobacteria bacterium]|nr:hypothetical protein [Gammaproteobacteria bacterium]
MAESADFDLPELAPVRDYEIHATVKRLAQLGVRDTAEIDEAVPGRFLID